MNLFLLLPRRLSTKIVGALIGFLLLALCAIGITLNLSWQLEGSSATINEAGALRMQSYRLTSVLAQLADEPQHAALRESANQQLRSIDASFARLQRGDPQRPLYLPPTDTIHADFENMVQHWNTNLAPLVTAILQSNDIRPLPAWKSYLAQIDGFVDEVNQLVQSIEQDSEKRMFWLRSSQLALVAMAITGTVVLIYLMFMLIIEPVSRLQAGMLQMNEKELGVRLPVESEDEFGSLTLGFNQMADRLETAYNNLENRVQQKTAELEDQNAELALLYDCAAFLQRPQPMEVLADGFLQRISKYFQADGSSVRVLEAARENLHMVVHQGLSSEMVESEHCMKVGDCLCGEAVEQKVAVIHNLQEMDQAHNLQCHREGFATVSIFHIYAHEQHLGFFNLHFRQARIFSQHERTLLETLGHLLGVAIENIRLAMREREMAISEERNLVAQGLHDSIAQGLTFLNLQVQMLDDSLQRGRMTEIAGIVPALRAGVNESYEDIRELLLNFRSRLVKGDLISSLETTVEKFRLQTGIAIDFTASGNGAPLPYEQQLQIMFIVQEALSNIRKHAQAEKVEIRLQDDQDFALSIHDDGAGFDVDALFRNNDSHVGIHIMRERAQRIHARFEVQSEPQQGTTVLLQLAREQRRVA
jgi:two-component system nitrate/nitrite sensor histidine kinase NarX